MKTKCQTVYAINISLLTIQREQLLHDAPKNDCILIKSLLINYEILYFIPSCIV